MLIPLDKIKPSPHPVRTSWDEDKMDELAQSIKEQGLIVPIKVRPDNGGYEIVYGHRRVEACKRVGLSEVEAWVEGLDDDITSWQALIENIQRESLTDLEEGLEFIRKQEQGYTQTQIAEKIGKSQPYVASRIHVARTPEVTEILYTDQNIKDEANITRNITKATDDKQMRQRFAQKVIEEGLSDLQARRISNAIKEAPTDQAKKRLLEWEYSPTIHDPELIRQRKEKHGAHDPIYRDNKPSPQKAFDDSPEIKMLLDALTMAISTFLDLIMQIKTVVEIGKLAPEGRQFMAHKLRSFRNKIDDLLAELED